MAILIYTTKPKILLKAIYEGINNNEIKTWKFDKEKDFTHTPEQWKNKAWLHPNISITGLQFGLIGEENIVMTKLIYGVYHGRFLEMLLTHFDDYFLRATITADKIDIDNFKMTSRFASICS
ncbi:hypothetical protein [Nostoc sp. WHI]|uniref:hypothetical protein n=1 Tax=Nostoc sp. WHI TaxID=2650611 RepID=UPI0018C714B7|nr:hypothetical protein [Nostoc sp. WHI]MBG1265512.1 hypothetical protein [Nostoc sp. WHI]